MAQNKLSDSPLILVGMHRSGTSMLSRFIEKSGYFMGDDLQGDHESLFFIGINNWILRQHNAFWDSPANYRFSSAYMQEHLSRAVSKRIRGSALSGYLGRRRYLRARMGGGLPERWGWKDPRNSITLNLWAGQFPGARILHIYRNPVDVALSLQTRESQTRQSFRRSWKSRLKERLMMGKVGYQDSVRSDHLSEGYALWKTYTQAILEHERNLGLPFMHIRYESFLADPEPVLRQLGNFLGIEVTDQLIGEISGGIEADRAFRFLQDPQGLELYQHIQNDPLMERLGYSNLLQASSGTGH